MEYIPHPKGMSLLSRPFEHKVHIIIQKMVEIGYNAFERH
jgi:hypothetical protein